MKTNNPNLEKLNQTIKSNSLEHVYVFSGPEIAIRDIYIKEIGNRLGLPIEYTDSIDKIKNRLFTKSFLSQTSLYIIIDDVDLLTDEKEFKRLKTINDSYVILLYNSTIDKRSKFYKEFSDVTVEFNYMESEDLLRYIKKDYNLLTEDYCKNLIAKCNNNYARILNELEKINTYNDVVYNGVGFKINNSYVDLMDYIYDEPKDAIFNMISQVLLKNKKEAFRLLEQCEGIGESNINILFNLYENFRKLFQIQNTVEKRNTTKVDVINKTTGIREQIIEIYLNKYRVNGNWKYTEKQLKDIMEIIKEVDTSIKKGLIDEEISVRYTLNKIFSI